MPRSPITSLAGGRSPRQRIWELIRMHQSGEFTGAEVTPGDVPAGTAREYLSGLVCAGYLAQTKADRRGVKIRYWLTRDNGIEAPRVRADGTEVSQGQGNEGLWGAISVLDTFTARQIADLAGVSTSTAKTYCMFLERAGYLSIALVGKGGGPTLYRTVRTRISGPRAPMITRIKAVYDPNLHQVVWMQGADELADEVLE
ncbi:MAG: hypothetical protein Q8O79_00990 [Pseudomonadota bacterium]|nr:hypothetical protein [Pseudomonadota bacterium]